jgi:hypothetical protein
MPFLAKPLLNLSSVERPVHCLVVGLILIAGSVSIDDRTLSGLPRPRHTDLREISLGAVLIGPFEGSRWRGGCGGTMGFRWERSVFAAVRQLRSRVARALRVAEVEQA